MKSAKEIKLDDAQSKIAESAEVIKPKFITENKGFAVRITEILAPQKFQHAFTVRVYSYALKFIVNLRKKANKRRLESGLKQRESLKIHQERKIKYRIFQYDEDKSETDGGNKAKTDQIKTPLTEIYGTICVVVGEKKNYDSKSNKRRFPDSPEKWEPVGQWRHFPHQAKRIEIQLLEDDLS